MFVYCRPFSIHFFGNGTYKYKCQSDKLLKPILYQIILTKNQGRATSGIERGRESPIVSLWFVLPKCNEFVQIVGVSQFRVDGRRRLLNDLFQLFKGRFPLPVRVMTACNFHLIFWFFIFNLYLYTHNSDPKTPHISLHSVRVFCFAFNPFRRPKFIHFLYTLFRECFSTKLTCTACIRH